MSDINTIFLTGRLGQDPEIKYFESGSVISNFSVAVNEYQGKDKPEKTSWFNCKAWAKKAEFIGEYAKQGSLVFVKGRLCRESYQTQNNEKRISVYILVDEIKIIDKQEK